MFCIKCGNEIKDGENVCSKCGTLVGKKSMKKSYNIIIIFIVAVVVIGIAGGVLFFNTDAYKVKKSIKEAQTAFTNETYEEAKKYYEEVLTFDETYAEAYLQIADIYMTENNYEKACETLKNGLEKNKENEEALTSLNEKWVQLCKAESDKYLEKGEFFTALEVLINAQEENKLAELEKAEKALRQNIFLKREEVFFDEESGKTIENIYEYDSAGNLIEHIYHGIAIGNTGEVYQYDDDGKLIKCISNIGSSVPGWSEYEYDETGSIITEYKYDADVDCYYGDEELKGKLECYYEYEYDENENVATKYCYDYDDVLRGIEDYIYDEFGNVVKKMEYDYHVYARLNGWTEYEYDDRGNLIRELYYNSDGTMKNQYIYAGEYIYNDAGFKVGVKGSELEYEYIYIDTQKNVEEDANSDLKSQMEEQAETQEDDSMSEEEWEAYFQNTVLLDSKKFASLKKPVNPNGCLTCPVSPE